MSYFLATLYILNYDYFRLKMIILPTWKYYPDDNTTPWKSGFCLREARIMLFDSDRSRNNKAVQRIPIRGDKQMPLWENNLYKQRL